MQAILKNGAFIQRRKLYNQTPVYTNKSHLQLDFHPENQQTQELKTLRQKYSYDRERVKRQYEHKVQRMIQQKYISSNGSIPMTNSHDSKNYKEQDTLAKQLNQFNSSKLFQVQNYRQDYHQYNDPLHDNIRENPQTKLMKPISTNDYYSKHKQQQKDDYNYSKGLHNGYQTIQQGKPNYYRRTENAHKSQSFHSQGKDRTMQYPNYQLELQRQYKRYAQITKGIPSPDYPFKNVIPDKLQNFLRQKVKADHRRSMDICVAPNRNQRAVK